MYDCVSCGACCFDSDVLLGEADLDRFEDQPRLMRLTVLHDWPPGLKMRFMRRESDGRCAALEGRLGAVCCSIYADRPHLCRAFEAGSEECREIRRRYGLPV